MKSNEKSHLLTFELDKKTKELEIHTNQEGLEILRKKIDILLKSENTNHTHLISKEWGGDDLTKQKQSEENELIDSVKIFKWT